jgi:hypothetical protein
MNIRKLRKEYCLRSFIIFISYLHIGFRDRPTGALACHFAPLPRVCAKFKNFEASRLAVIDLMRRWSCADLFDLIRRNGEIDRHHLRIVCELAELPALTPPRRPGDPAARK